MPADAVAAELYVVTGSSRGLGAALVDQLLQPGRVVLGIARRTNPALDESARTRGASLEQWPLDLAEPLAAAQRLQDWLVAQDAARFERAVLINNAGALHPPAALRDAELAALSTVLRVGLEAALLLAAAFLRGTRGWRAERRVLNVSSGLGRRAMASSAAYCAAKAGMDHFTRCLALEEAAQDGGARVVSLAPGVIDTDMQVQLRAAAPDDFPDRDSFVALQREGKLLSADAAAARLLAWLDRPGFGSQPVADVRDPA